MGFTLYKNKTVDKLPFDLVMFEVLYGCPKFWLVLPYMRPTAVPSLLCGTQLTLPQFGTTFSRCTGERRCRAAMTTRAKGRRMWCGRKARTVAVAPPRLARRKE